MTAPDFIRHKSEFSTWVKRWTGQLNVNPFSWREALDLFEDFNSRIELAFDVAAGGCEARAHLMCAEIIKRGHKAYKAWAFSEAMSDAEHVSSPDEKTLNPILPDGQRVVHKNGEGWFFHVTLALPVLLSSGQCVYLVFDPTLFDAPVRIHEWGRAMAHSAHLQICPFGRVPTGFFGDYIPTLGNTRRLLKAPATNPVKVLERLREAYPYRPHSEPKASAHSPPRDQSLFL